MLSLRLLRTIMFSSILPFIYMWNVKSDFTLIKSFKNEFRLGILVILQLKLIDYVT